MMRLLKISPEVHHFRFFKDFAREFSLGKGDFVLTHEVIYDNFMKDLGMDFEFIFQEKYGDEPSEKMINDIIADQKDSSYRRIIAVGGGSVIDIAKILALKGIKDSLDIFEKRTPMVKDKTLIVVPTTCGTGSEVTNIAIAKITAKQTKMGLVADELYPDYAVLVPELLIDLPYKFFLYSSIDALIHAMESYLSPRANAYTDLFAAEAIRILLRGYKILNEQGESHSQSLNEQFLMASNYAGISFGNAGVGAVHALSYPLSGMYNVAHGEANYQFFTAIFRLYNEKLPHGKIASLNAILAACLGIQDGDDVYVALEATLGKLIATKQLATYGMAEQEIALFTEIVIEKQQRLLANNYVPLTKEDIYGIYRALY